MVVVGGLRRTKFNDEGAGLRRATGAARLLATFLLLDDDKLVPAEIEGIGRGGKVRL